MLPPVARLAGVFTFALLAVALARADDTEPKYDGKKMSQWVDTLQNDPVARRRAIAVDALGKIWHANEDKKALANICRALRRDSSAAVRTRAAVVLGGLTQKDSKHSIDDLVAALGTEKESRVRKEIIATLAKYPEACVLAVEPLTAALKDSNVAVKVAAAEALAIAGDKAKSAAPGLVPLLKDADKGVRRAAVYALGRIHPEGAATIAVTMATMLGAEKDSGMKRELIAALGLFAEKSEPVVKALTAALADTDAAVRRSAARTLGTFGTSAAPAAETLLHVATTDKVDDIRVDAVRAFGTALGPAGVKTRLKDLLPRLDPKTETSGDVRLAVVGEVGALGYEHLGVDLVSRDPKVKAAAETTLATLRKRRGDPQLAVRDAADRAIHAIITKPVPKKDPEPKKNP